MSSVHPEHPVNIVLLHGPELTGAGLDPQEFSRRLAELPHARVLAVDLARPEQEQRQALTEFLAAADRQPVVVAAKEPEHRAQVLSRLREELGLPPSLVAPVDLTPALDYPELDLRRAKGLELVRLAAAQLRRAVPVGTQTVPVSRQVLVWGDSYAALRAALELASRGFPVLLASSGPAPSPLAFEYARGTAGGEALAGLTRQAQEHPLIKPLYEAQLLDFQGTTGRFGVRLLTPQGRVNEQVGAVVLAPELHRQPALCCYPVPEDPRILCQNRLEALLEENPEGLPGMTALLVGLAGEGHPLSLKRALAAAHRLLTAGREVCLLVGNAKLAGPGIERALRQAQEAGLVLIKLKDCPAIEVGEAGVSLSFFEPSLRKPVILRPDLVVLDDHYRAAAENVRLAEAFRLELGPRGFLQDDNVHLLPVATYRKGILAVGPARGLLDLEETEADIQAAVLAVQELLGDGYAQAPQGRAVVDRGRCVLCLTCYRYCPHGAITWDSRAIINELACQGCGICASQCPNDAIQVFNYSDEQVVSQLTALDPGLSPRMVAFLCRNSAWEAYQSVLRLKAGVLPPGFAALQLPCAGKVDAEFLLQAFAAGAEGVLVLGCPPDNCKSSHGNLCADKAVSQVQAMLAEAGVEPFRLAFRSLAANGVGDFLDAVDHFLAELAALTPAPDAEHPLRLALGTTCARPAVRWPGSMELRELSLEVHPQDAEALGLRPGDVVTVGGREERLQATVRLNPRVRPGTAYLPASLDQAVVQRLAAEAQEGARLPRFRGLAVYLARRTEEFEEIFGVRVPLSRYLHQGHTWVALESGGRVRLGLDDFSQKLLGPGDGLQVPLVGEEIRRNLAHLVLYRGKNPAPVLAPLYGVVEKVNPKVLSRPSLVHDDPYGDGWILEVAPISLEPDLEKLIPGTQGVTWMEEETLRLIALLDPGVGATLQAGGVLLDDIYGQYPDLGWERLVKEFLRSGK
ncbi:MAG: hydrogenase iron-sulfur subunit [Syntrophobacterales bacterium]|nr:hydrogenase iron-sulfur subunit [Syntrophobacterales bacterium]